MIRSLPTAAALLCVALVGCVPRSAPLPAGEATQASAEQRSRSGGTATVFDSTVEAFGFPLPNLSRSDLRDFFAGNRLFRTDWVLAPASVDGLDGLGPLYNRTACAGCHARDGRGRAPADGQERLVSMLVRLDAAADEGGDGAPLAHPAYGLQIQEQAIPGVEAEARVRIDYEEFDVILAGGEVQRLRRPRIRLEEPAYGPLEGVALSALVAPAVFGAGLLEAIPSETLLTQADEHDRDRDGISGRIRRVWSPAQRRLKWGRFGWKAGQATLLDQITSALIHDIGITSRVFPAQNVAPQQRIDDPRSGGNPEIGDEALRRLLFYQRALAVPARRDVDDPAVRRGELLFERLRCSACHLPTVRTGPFPALPALGEQTLHPYTDLLLHDMGEGLDDGRRVFGADGREWRTPPLWGLGLISTVNGHTDLLHDGRARNPTEAILWHGGEAQASRDAFKKLGPDARRELLAFLDSL